MKDWDYSESLQKQLKSFQREIAPYVNVSGELNELHLLLNSFSAKPVIVTTGVMNAGKSMLLNALIQKPEYFPTGVVRETIVNKMLEIDNYIMIDTPGVNANQEDTDEAIRAYKQADLLLFVYNLIEGELKSAEVELISRLSSYFPSSEEFWNRIVFVGSNRHQLEDEQVTKVNMIIKEQILKRFGVEVNLFFAVDSLSYLKGLVDEKKMLCESSGINELLHYIDEKSQELKDRKFDIFKRRVFTIVEKMEDTIRGYVVSRQQEKQIVGEQKQKLVELSCAVEELINTVQRKMLEERKRLDEKKAPSFPYDYIYFSVSTYSSQMYRSESEAERAGGRAFQEKCYSRIDSKIFSVQKQLSEIIELYQYYEQSMDNPYFKIELELRENIVQFTDELLQQLEAMNLKRTLNPKISFNIRPIKLSIDPHEISSILRDYESCDWYVRCNINTYETIRYERGLFGREREVEYYRYDFSPAVRELESDLKSNINNAVSYMKSAFSSSIAGVIDDLKEGLDKYEQNLMKWLSNHSKDILLQIRDVDNKMLHFETEEKKLEKAIMNLKATFENEMRKGIKDGEYSRTY